MDILGTLQNLWLESGFSAFFMAGGWKNLVMILIAFVLLYLGIVKKFEPLLLCGIAFIGSEILVIIRDVAPEVP